MVKFKVSLKDLLGKAYYQYTLTSTHYNTTPSQTDITITCTCKNILGNPVANKELTLYYKNSIQGTATTNELGMATWTVGTLEYGINQFRVEDATIIINARGWETVTLNSGGTYATLYVNKETRTAELRYVRDFNSASADTFYSWHTGAIPQDYRPSTQVNGSFNQVGTLYIDSTGEIGGKFANSWSSTRTVKGSVMWHY